MIRRLGIAAVRALVLAFCWLTALYAFIASSAFAYLQFIKPRVFHWVGAFSDWHWAASWVWLVLIVVLLWPHLRMRGRGALAARGLMACAFVAVTVNTSAPILPSLHDGPRSAVVGVMALLPIIWLGVIDHLTAWPFVVAQSGASDERGQQEQDGRVFAACMGAAMLLTAGYAVLASISVGRAFEPDLLSSGLMVGVASSLLGHLLVFSAVFVVLAVAARVGGRSIVRQYFVLLGAATLLFAGLFARFVGDSVGLSSPSANAAALAAGASMAVAWGGMRLTGHARAGRRLTAGLDAFFTPPADGQPGRRFVVALVAVLPLAWGFALFAGRIDWDFALLKSGVVIVWLLTFALLYRAAPVRHVPSLVIAVACGLPVVVQAAWHQTGVQQHARERYAVHNPSFLLTDGLLREKKDSSSFDRYLRANTGLNGITVKPVPIDLVTPLAPVPQAQRPLVFLLVVDSLRSDYLSPYNPDVHFTPRMAEFAAENLFFPNAFTRYGGTGLSMPAIWAGSVLAHKQYVLPFDAMNALQKLVDVNGYRRIQTHDHITDALWTRSEQELELDRGRDEMDFDFCATVEQMGAELEKGVASNGPVFGQTRSLNLHVASVRNGYVPPGKSYPGFEPPYAYRIERIDGCFGSFIDRLKRLKLYDRSIVVLTADHGELIGEDGRWGHSYHMFPQVIQVPLLVHLPKDATPTAVDRGAVALSTDITPTIYAALGYQASSASALAGHSLTGGGPEHLAARRRRSHVLSASYGAVYAVVSRNGRRLYIADAIQEQEHAYARASLTDLRWSEVTVDEGARMLGQLRIRRQIDTIGRTYGVDPPF